MRQAIKKTIIKITGLFLTVLGFTIFVLPLPLGIPVMALGLVMLISTSKTARRTVRLIRLRFNLVDRFLTMVETHVPGHTRSVLRKTRRRVVGRSRPNGV